MGEREIREKYGGKLAKAINRAIRAEVPGGNEALDTLTDLAGPAMHSGWKDRSANPTPEAVAYFKHKRGVVDRMEATVRKTWGISLDLREKRSRPPRRRAGEKRIQKPAGKRSGKRPNQRAGKP